MIQKLMGLGDGTYVMLKDFDILKDEDYINALKENKVSPKDTFALIHSMKFAKRSELFYPFLMNIDNIIDVILSRRGLYLELFNMYYVFPADPVYIIYSVEHRGQTAVEIIDINDAIAKTNAEKIVVEGLKNVEIYEYHDIRREFMNGLKLGGHDMGEVREILFKYYDMGEKSLLDEVEKIIWDYYKLFKPVRFYL